MLCLFYHRLASFIGMANSFDQYPRDWHLWYQSGEPENTPLPGEWENSCNELQRMLIVRSLRPDRVPFCVTTFIINNLDAKSVCACTQSVLLRLLSAFGFAIGSLNPQC